MKALVAALFFTAEAGLSAGAASNANLITGNACTALSAHHDQPADPQG